jgi:DNA invertase Pin-like site-specific DNA recombinase
VYSIPDGKEFVNSDSLPVALYCRVSKPDYESHLTSMVAALERAVCWDFGWHRGLLPDTSRIVATYQEVANGADFDRPAFQDAIEHARRVGGIVVAPDLNRLVRHPDYCPAKGFDLRPTKDQIRELLAFGVPFYTAVDPRLPASILRSLETKRGMEYSGKRGGRPKGGTLTDEKRREVLRFLAEHYKVREVAFLTKVPRSTVQELKKKTCPGKG